ncbi:hypothetical protein N7603_08010 [Acholeplasma vituli]|uniref:DUF1934 domain-containing protein n=1 Tax=Paracholeplasma vituli TaxID=69473 RepID=A0ABT2Q0S7_9MOLU|nr:hypothetical protein [Paracholeplasma vituli]MCU0105602.1 hypothetical protein [Paracholeplasma vituli]
MIISITTDQQTETYQVESTFEPGKITYQDPTSDSLVTVYFKLNEVLIRRTGEVTFQESYILNQTTMGYYRQQGILFKSIVETKSLIVQPDLIDITYRHHIEGITTEKSVQFRLFK